LVIGDRSGDTAGAGERPPCLPFFAATRKLILGRRLHGQVCGLLTLEDAVDVTACLSELVNDIGPVRDQAATGDVITKTIDGRQLVARCNRNDQTR
jgi:hypothetical protein